MGSSSCGTGVTCKLRMVGSFKDWSKTFHEKPVHSFEMFTSIIIHLRLVSRRKAAVPCLDEPKPLRFHVWHALPVTVVIPLLPTGGFSSPAFPPPSSVTRAQERERHNYRTEEIITQHLSRLYVTDQSSPHHINAFYQLHKEITHKVPPVTQIVSALCFYHGRVRVRVHTQQRPAVFW